jgi:hypothetical protein
MEECMMQGEINVSEFMDRLERLNEWSKRQARDAEWIALKQWWRAERRLRTATTPEQRARTRRDRATTAWLYRHELRRAWPKWEQVRLARWGTAALDLESATPEW